MKKKILSFLLIISLLLSITPINVYAANNVYNKTQNTWYDTLSAATAAAANGDTIEVYNSFTEITSVKIQKQNLTIKAAEGKNPTISWSQTDSIPVLGATSYSCVVIYTNVNTATTFGGGTGTLTFDASNASDDDNKGARARVVMHCGSGKLNIKDGIIITGGNPGGGSYESHKDAGKFPSWSGEVTGEQGFGSGIYMYNGTLNMSGGIIKDNYSLWGTSPDHNYVGGGGGVYLYNGTMNMTGGTITHNAAGSGGGAGILVGFGAKLNVSGGTISDNVCNFASGGGIGVRTQSEVTVSGGTISNNKVEGHGGGLFARGDSIPLKITGGVFVNNTAGGYGGGVLFWTVGDDVTKNTIVISGDVVIKNNSASRGGGVSVGREVLNGKPIGNKAKLIIEGNPEISGNTATTYGGGIDMQSDEFSTSVNTVEISGGIISNNQAEDGGGIYVPGGTVTMTGGSFNGNKASGRGAGIFTGGGTMTINNAHFDKNIAKSDGGGVFVQGGSVIMNSGTFAENEAANGGAMYVNKGDITMNGGEVESNKTNGNGGALYIAEGNFTMKSGSMIENKAIGTTSNGGGAYVEGGDITIGIENCNGAGANHSVNPTDKIHPVIQNNSATDSGGGIALIGEGDITMYCGNVIDNDTTTNKGRGLNIYMEKGTFDYYKGDIGDLNNTDDASKDPDLVIVGGTLKDNNHTDGDIKLKYYHCNDQDVFKEPHEGDYADKLALATKDSYINLPDGEKYWTAPSGYRFFGWTFYGENAANAPEHVRKKPDYKPLGTPIKVEDTYDGIADGTIDMYALWAPEISDITYAGSVIDGSYVSDTLNMTGNPNTYNFSYDDYEIKLNAPVKPGYEFKGWYIYQDEGQNANWGLEPVYNDGTTDTAKSYNTLNYSSKDFTFLEADSDTGMYTLKVEATNFGDLTLIASFVTATADLTIDKAIINELGASTEDDQSFIFNVTGDPANPKLPDVNLTVTVQNDGEIRLNDLPVGKYAVSEATDWSWRYTLDSVTSADTNVTIENKIANVVLNKNGSHKTVTFTNKLSENKWLSSECYCRNWWNNNKVERIDEIK